MKDAKITSLKQSDFNRLMHIPEQELLGEIIRLNHTIYSNTLDVIKVCSFIKKKRSVA